MLFQFNKQQTSLLAILHCNFKKEAVALFCILHKTGI